MRSLGKILVVLALLCVSAYETFGAGITNYAPLLQSSYWAQRLPEQEKVILDPEAIKAYNKSIMLPAFGLVNLATYPNSVTASAVHAILSDCADYLKDEDLYYQGEKVTEAQFNTFRRKENRSNIPATAAVRYAVTVRRTNLRALPYKEGFFSSPTDTEFDNIQETALDPGEAVLVLHRTATGDFYLVQAANYAGWLDREDLAFTTKDKWQTYLNPASYLVVVGTNLKLTLGQESINYQMGSRLPLKLTQGRKYRVVVPTRDGQGKLKECYTSIAIDNALVHKGYLSYTTDNILREALKWHKYPYGWGGFHESVDCSSLVYNVYRTVGIYLPRDADTQEKMPGRKYNLSGLSEETKTKLLKGIRPGATCYMPNHVLIYLGQNDNRPYFIHAIGSYYKAGVKQRVLQVVVSDLTLCRSNGNTMLSALRTVHAVRP